LIQIAILTTDPRLDDMLRSSGLKSSRIEAAELAAYAHAAEAPQVVVVDVRGRDQLPAGLAAFRRQHPGAGLVLVVSTLDPRLMLEGMRAGVNECIPEPVAAKTLEDAVRRVLTNAAPQPAGQVFAFVGAKGGVGATTLAVNTAAALGRSAPGQVLVMDLHVGHGDAAVFLGAEPRFSIIDAMENIHRVDQSFFSGIVEKTDAGVHLLASSPRSVHAALDGRRVRTLLETAAQTYKTTVLDVPRAAALTLEALDVATAIIVVTSQEIASLRHAAAIAETLRQRFGSARVKVVINRFHRDSVIAHADIERAVGVPVKHMLPSDYRAAVAALNAGRPIALDSDGRLGAALQALAKDLTGVAKQRGGREPGGMLARLAWRRA
jgi:pilus assembly protein CpaE